MVAFSYLRGYYPVEPDREGICFSLSFIVEDDSGMKIYTSGGGWREADDVDLIFSRRVAGCFEIDPDVHQVFQRENQVYVALRKNERFNRIKVDSIPPDELRQVI